MKNHLKRISLFCGIAVIMLAAFPVFAQDKPEINRKPLNDLNNLVIDRLQKNELVLSDNFLVEVEGELTKDGKFDPQKTKYIRTEGNEQIANVAKSAIEAVNESGMFQYLTNLGSTKLNLVFSQNDEQIYGTIKFDFVSSARAKSLVSLLNSAISIVKQKSDNEDDKVLLNGTTVSENDKTVTIKTSVEKSVGQEMIQRKLTEELNKRLEQEKAK
jgi:hypothetical protein